MSRTTGRPAEVLREGSGIKIEGTVGDWAHNSTYIKDAGNPSWQRTSQAGFINQLAQSNEFLLRRAVTGTSLLTLRGYALQVFGGGMGVAGLLGPVAALVVIGVALIVPARQSSSQRLSLAKIQSTLESTIWLASLIHKRRRK